MQRKSRVQKSADCDAAGLRELSLLEMLLASGAILAAFGALTSVTLIAASWMILAGVVVVGSTRYRKQDRPGLALVVILSVCSATPVTRLPGVSSTFLAAFAVVLGCSTAVGLFSRPAPRPLRGIALLLIVLSTVMVTSVAAGSVESIFRFGVIVVLPVLGCFLLAARLDPESRRTVGLVLIVLGLVQAILAIAEVLLLSRHFGPAAQLDSNGDPKALLNELLPFLGDRAQGTLGHPLALAFLLAASVGVVLRLPGIGAAARWTAVATLTLGIAASGSRSALLACVLLVAFTPRGPLTFARAIAAALSASLMMLLLVSTGFALDRVLSDFSGTGSYTHRVAAFDAAYRLWFSQDVAATFLGNGYGSTARLFKEGVLQSDGFNAVDNQFVLMLAQGGLLAFLAFLALSVVAIVRGNRLLRTATLVVLVNSFVFDWLNWPSASTVGLFVLGAALAGSPEDRREPCQGHSAAPTVCAQILSHRDDQPSASPLSGDGLPNGSV